MGTLILRPAVLRAIRHLVALRLTRRVPFVAQDTGADCGLACLAMVLRFFGVERSVESLRSQGVGQSGHGNDLKGLLTLARRFGMEGRGVRVEWSDLRSLSCPSILHWGLDHFVVLESAGPRSVRIVDPAAGPKRVPRSVVRLKLTGVAIELRPTQRLPTGRDQPTSRRRFIDWRLLVKERAFLKVVGATVVVQAASATVPLGLAVLIDRVIGRGEHQLLLTLAAATGLIACTYFGASLVRTFSLLDLRTTIDYRLTTDLFSHVVSLPLRFFDGRPVGELLLRTNSASMIRQIVTDAALASLFDGVLVLAIPVAVSFLSPLAALFLAFLALVHFVLYACFRGRMYSLAVRLFHAQARSRSIQIQVLAGIEALKALSSEARSVASWSSAFVEELNEEVRRGRVTGVVDGVLGTLGVASPLAVGLLGAQMVVNEDLRLGTLMALSAFSIQFLMPLRRLVMTGFQLQFVRGFVEKVEDLMAAAAESPGAIGPRQGTDKSLTARGLGFSYGQDAGPVLRDVEVEILEGSWVAIVGKSGCGKSTLARLLSGLYEPTEGEVLLGGEQVEPVRLRERVVLVPEASQVFSMSVRDNITLLEEYSDAEVEDAARCAEVHEEVERLPFGYDSLLAEGGRNLSAGQRQRLALARAILRRPDVLVLDEATSALDPATELSVLRRLAARDCTLVHVSHRLSPVQQAGEVFVLSHGTIRESGAHDVLVQRGGIYTELFSTAGRERE